MPGNTVGIIMVKRYMIFNTARLVAFNLFDEMYNSRREAQPYWDDDRWIYQE